MQTILGSGGAIGRELALNLPKYTKDIRLVSRHPEKVNDTDQLFSADLLDRESVLKAVKGSDIVYLTVGFPYRIGFWRMAWPQVIDHVLDACQTHHSKLVFFDNVYMYDPETVDNLSETNPVNPTSKKGKVRAEIAQKILDAIKSGNVKALIARAADFYGPSIEKVSVLTETVFEPLSKGGKAQILGSVDKFHSYTFTPDAGKALAILANTPDAYGEIWHLPTSNEKWTTRQFIENIASQLNTKPRYIEAGKILVGILGLFMPLMKELKEMLYQYENDYFFNSEKFQKRFGFKPTAYDEGIKQVVKTDYKRRKRK